MQKSSEAKEVSDPRVLFSPEPFLKQTQKKIVVFLAGTFASWNWQKWICANFQFDDPGVLLLNPRRPDVDMSKTPSTEQILWTLAAMEEADIVFMHLEPKCLSHISLLEMGLWMRSGKLIVSCGPGFDRFATVLVTARLYGCPCLETIDKGLLALRTRISALYDLTLTEQLDKRMSCSGGRYTHLLTQARVVEMSKDQELCTRVDGLKPKESEGVEDEEDVIQV